MTQKPFDLFKFQCHFQFSNFVHFGPYDLVHLVQISSACGPNTYQIMYGKTLAFHAVLTWSTVARLWVARKSFYDKFTVKRIFRSGIYVAITDSDNESSKSFHTLFDKYLDHMLVKFEQDRTVVKNIQNFEFFCQKMVFEKVFTPFLIQPPELLVQPLNRFSADNNSS